MFEGAELTLVKWGGIFLVCVVAVATAFTVGENHGKEKIQAQWDHSKVVVGEAVKNKDDKVLAAVVGQASDAQANGQDLQVQTQIIYEKGATIIKKVPIYVTEKDDSDCSINNGFVGLWNAANGAGPVELSGGSGGGPGATGQGPGTEDHDASTGSGPEVKPGTE